MAVEIDAVADADAAKAVEQCLHDATVADVPESSSAAHAVASDAENEPSASSNVVQGTRADNACVGGSDGAVDAGAGDTQSAPSITAAAAAAKEAGNQALKSADLPLAIERYEESVRLCEEALSRTTQPKHLRNNEVVKYGDSCFAIVETAYPHFGDYCLEDLGTGEVVKHKVTKYEEVPKRFRRSDLLSVPQDLFDLRLACLQNLTLVSLKIARGSSRARDFEETVRRANDALAMNGCAPKALMRKGAALIELKDIDGAGSVLALAAQATRGKDEEVMRLLRLVMDVKGKGKGKGGVKGRGRGKGTTFAPKLNRCRDPNCNDEGCGHAPPSSSEDEAGDVREANMKLEESRSRGSEVPADKIESEIDGGTAPATPSRNRLPARSVVVGVVLCLITIIATVVVVIVHGRGSLKNTERASGADL
eukprot:TRINITY_DN68782_c0_g1_i1.p1 TRINITY_DN68782_c0_g1~~TRINITY_DN68782_c0_g1_i1.p1  ORF type:complete len:438 (+),score=79.03 TRINITY_DN68782_c0_g1_i1:48-1316(+)